MQHSLLAVIVFGTLMTSCATPRTGSWPGSEDLLVLAAAEPFPVTATAMHSVSPTSEPEAGAQEVHGHGGDGPPEFERNAFFVTMAVVNEVRGGGGPGYGLEYEYQLSEHWGIAGFGEFVMGDLEIGVFGLLGYWHPTDRLAIGLGPGVETSSEETEGMIRLGGFYEFEAGEIVIGPNIYFDYLPDHGEVAVVLGMQFGKKW